VLTLDDHALQNGFGTAVLEYAVAHNPRHPGHPALTHEDHAPHGHSSSRILASFWACID
jgi:hypothetical protein